MQGVLTSIERVGNKLPHPFILFTVLAALVVVVSAINPQTGDEVVVRSLLSAEGVEFMLTSVVSNFVNFPPLGLASMPACSSPSGMRCSRASPRKQRGWSTPRRMSRPSTTTTSLPVRSSCWRWSAPC